MGPGVANDSEGSPRELTGKPLNSRKIDPPTEKINSTNYAANFEDFLNKKPSDKPWAFWYGCTEPHRAYEYKSGVKKGGKSLEDIKNVFSFWPDDEIVRNDILDYALEIEHFDSHLGRILEVLEQRGELDNTLVIVTWDNGMPFPRIKAQSYALSNHMPLAIMWKEGIPHPGRTVEDYVSFVDLAPTILEAVELTW